MSGAGAIVNHIGQCVVDIERSRRFYVELLGFEVDRSLVPDDAATAALLRIERPVGLQVLYLRRGDVVLELMQFDRPGNPPFRPREFNEPGLTHLSLCVDDLEATVARVPELGGEVFASFSVATMVRDPDGQLLELLPMAYRQMVEAERAAARGDGPT